MKDLKRRLLELGMTCLLLAGVFCLSREGARMAGKISPGGPVVVIDAGHGGMDPGKVGVIRRTKRISIWRLPKS